MDRGQTDDQEGWIAERMLEYQSHSNEANAPSPEDFVAALPAELPLRERLLERLRLLGRIEGGFATQRGETIGPGTVLEDFEVLELLGAGGMGRVFLARQKSVARTVALKVPHRGAALEPRARARFLREAQAVAQLRHASIVPVFQVGEHRGAPFLVMEYSSGRSLAAILGDLAQGRSARKGEALGRPAESYERAAAQVIVSMLAALQAAHEAGVVHRDVKPGNVLLEEHGCVRVVDFGLARLADQDSLTESRELIGTAGYMAPEAVRSSAAASALSDVYSAGVVLYQLLALRRPFEGATALEILRRVEAAELAPLAATDRVDKPLSAIVEKAMAREVSRRYASAGAFADDLRAYLDGREVLAQPSTLWTRLGRRLHRHPAATSAGVVLAVVLALLAGVWRSERTALAQIHQSEATKLAREGFLWQFAGGELGGEAPRQVAGHLRAIDDIEGSLELNPNLLEARVELAQYTAMQGQKDRSLELIGGLEADGVRLLSLAWTRVFLTGASRVIGPSPGDGVDLASVPALDRLAWARYFLSTYQMEKAMEVLGPVEHDPILGPAAMNMQFEACCTRGVRDRPRGMSYLRGALAIVPDHPILLSNMAAMQSEELHVLREKEQPTEEEARRQRTLLADMACLLPRLAMATESAPQLRVLWLNSASLLLDLGRQDDALEVARRGLDQHPGDAALSELYVRNFLSRWSPDGQRSSGLPNEELDDLRTALEAWAPSHRPADFLYLVTWVQFLRQDRIQTKSWGERASTEYFDKAIESPELEQRLDHLGGMMDWAIRGDDGR